MVYGKIIYNNVKEYTPQWMKTIPYSQTVKPFFGRRSQIVSNFNADPKVKAFWRFLGRNVQNYPWLWQIYIFFNSWVLFQVCYYPWLWVYQANNKHRTLDYALKRERDFKASQESQE